jgi:hypothetical protein
MRRLYPRPCDRPADKRGYRADAKGRPWRKHAHKEPLGGRRWSAKLLVSQHCVADLLSQRQLHLDVSLAGYSNAGLAPIHIGDLHGHDVACTQSETGQEQKHSTVSQAHGRVFVARADDAIHIRRRQNSVKKPPSARSR